MGKEVAEEDYQERRQKMKLTFRKGRNSMDLNMEQWS